MTPDTPLMEAETLPVARRARDIRLATVESRAGGPITAAIAGASDAVDRGFVTCSNEARTGLIGVPLSLRVARPSKPRP